MIINDGHGTEVNRAIDISCALIFHVNVWIQSLIPNTVGVLGGMLLEGWRDKGVGGQDEEGTRRRGKLSLKQFFDVFVVNISAVHSGITIKISQT